MNHFTLLPGARRVNAVVVAIVVVLLAVAIGGAVWHHRQHRRELTARALLRTVVADSVARLGAARERARLDTLRSHYETRLEAQKGRYHHQVQADATLEMEYRRAATAGELPAF